MQATAFGRLSVLSKQLAPLESEVPAQLNREDCAATQTILFALPAYDGAAFAKAAPALFLSKDASVPSQETSNTLQPEPSFGRPSLETSNNPQPYSASLAIDQRQSHDALPAFSRPVGGHRDHAPHQAAWLSKVDAIETPAGYQLDVALHGAPDDVRVEVQGRQLRIAGLRFPPPRPQLLPPDTLFSSELLGSGLMLRQDEGAERLSALWTLPKDCNGQSLQAAFGTSLLCIKLLKH